MQSSIEIVFKGNLYTPEVIRFSAGEFHPKLPTRWSGESLEVHARIFEPSWCVALALVLDALEHMGCGVYLQMPYMPYSRQDRVYTAGQAHSMDWFARSILSSPCINEICTWDIHSFDSFTTLCARSNTNNIINIQQSELIRVGGSPLWERLRQETELVLVQADAGAEDRCDKIYSLGIFNGGRCKGDKKLNPDTGWIESYNVSGCNVKGKVCFIPDDICDGGATFKILASKLKSMGAKCVILFVTHGIFSNGVDEIYGDIDEIYTTNSMPERHKVDGIVRYDFF